MPLLLFKEKPNASTKMDRVTHLEDGAGRVNPSGVLNANPQSWTFIIYGHISKFRSKNSQYGAAKFPAQKNI